MRKLAKILFSMSSFFKSLGKIVNGKTIVVDVLTLPGWFIIDECIIHMTPLKDKKILSGINWEYWPMPDKWCDIMNELKRKMSQ